MIFDVVLDVKIVKVNINNDKKMLAYLKCEDDYVVDELKKWAYE